MKHKISIIDIVSAAASAGFLIGIISWFKVCDGMSDSIMSCHWAGEVLKAMALLSVCLNVIHLFAPSNEMKIGMDVSHIGICVLALNVPGRIISICSMAAMSCRKNTVPWTVVFCVAIIILSLADIVTCLDRENKEKHKRKD